MKIDFVRLNRLDEEVLVVEIEGSCAQKPFLMTNSTFFPSLSLCRGSLFLVLISALLVTTSCGLFGTHKKVQVPPLLTPLAEANKTQLINEVNRLAAVPSIHGKVDILFEDTSFADVGVAEKYKQADGTITLQRPGNVYLIIQVPFIATDIAQMTSDGQGFRVAVLQGEEKYRRFVKGTNNARYEKLDLDGAPGETTKKKKTMSGKETVNALSNLRPQHLTEAFMIRPITSSDPNFVFSQSEFFQEEPDVRLKAKKGARVVRGYYLLEEFAQPKGGDLQLMRRIWFDRVGEIRLARMQTFDERGLMLADVAYLDEKPTGSDGRKLPSRIDITRPREHYRLSIAYQAPASVDLGREYKPEAFVLENRWQLPEVDLDARHMKRANSSQ
jgi:hypothetical protein